MASPSPANPPQSQPFFSEQILWYNVGQWGQLGYAVPNFGANPVTLNDTISQVVEVSGRNLFAIMQSPDVDLRTPPSINTLTRMHKLIIRARSILSNRAVPPGQPRMEPKHGTPAGKPFIIFPVPYWQVANSYLKEWCGLILQGLSECMQNTENRVQFDVTTTFAGLVGQYLQRIYVQMATELFGVELGQASSPTFTISDAQLAAYDPTKWFTSTEMIDSTPPPAQIPSALDLIVLERGIAATQLVGLATFPGLSSSAAGAGMPPGLPGPSGSFAAPPSP